MKWWWIKVSLVLVVAILVIVAAIHHDPRPDGSGPFLTGGPTTSGPSRWGD